MQKKMYLCAKFLQKKHFMTRKNVNFASLWDGHPAWEMLTPGERAYIESESEVVDYAKKEKVFQAGDFPECLMILLTGKVREYIGSANQKPQIVRLVAPGEFFSYLPILSHSMYSTSATAIEPSCICKVRREALMRVLNQNNQICMYFLARMSSMLEIARYRQVVLTQKHVRGRMADALLTLKARFGTESDGKTLGVILSREDISNISSMTTANAIRTIRQLTKEGVIATHGKRIIIEDEVALIHIAETD